ncbi:MAG TPA: hypothetical protein VHT34_00605 [Clostridia bacterium]|nr:hypothetical protein [Clostridia bacterium]
MENDSNVVIGKKAWNPSSLKLICFFSLVSSIILYVINFHRLDHPKKFRNTIIGISAFIGMTILALISPVFSWLILLVNTFTAIYLSDRQKEIYKEFINKGGKKASSLLAWILGSCILFVYSLGLECFYLLLKGYSIF